MAKRRAGRLHYNKTARKIGWIKTRVNATSYKTMRGYINRLFKDDRNYEELVRRMDLNSPNIFKSPYSSLQGKKQDKEAVLDFVTEHAKQVWKDMNKGKHHATFEQAVKKEFNTRVYVSQDELIQNNMKTFLQRRGNRDEYLKALDALNEGREPDELVRRLPYNKIRYYDSVKVLNPVTNTVEEYKAYLFEGTNVGFYLTGSGNKKSPYIYNLARLDIGDNVWKDVQ